MLKYLNMHNILMVTMKGESRIFRAYETDMDWFYTNYNNFKETVRDRFVVVKDSRIVIEAKTPEELKEKAEKQDLDLTQSLVKYIPKEDVTLIL